MSLRSNTVKNPTLSNNGNGHHCNNGQSPLRWAGCGQSATASTPRHEPASNDPARLRLADTSPSADHIIEPLLSLNDLAAILNCSRRWLERERSAGRVPRPNFMTGRCPRWKPATIRRWIEGGGSI
jgi:hypothetical protein